MTVIMNRSITSDNLITDNDNSDFLDNWVYIHKSPDVVFVGLQKIMETFWVTVGI